jgi:hypothetical protein
MNGSSNPADELMATVKRYAVRGSDPGDREFEDPWLG